MNDYEQLIKLIFQKHVKDNQSYDYDYQTLDILRACVAKVEFEKSNPNSYFRDRDVEFFYDEDKSLTQLLSSGYIGFAVRTGGNSGGNCWGGEPSYEAASEYTLDNEYLDKVLEVIAPEVTYLTYRKIEKSIIQTTEYTKHEYYGNNDVFHVQLIPIQPLVEMLAEKKSLIPHENVFSLISQYENSLTQKKNKP